MVECSPECGECEAPVTLVDPAWGPWGSLWVFTIKVGDPMMLKEPHSNARRAALEALRANLTIGRRMRVAISPYSQRYEWWYELSGPVNASPWPRED